MECKDREGNIISMGDGQDKVLKSLYTTKPGKEVLRFLVNPAVSKLGARFFDSKLSTYLIPGFIARNKIDMLEYVDEDYESFNHFFTRRIKDGKREFDKTPENLCAPCDSKLSVYKITSRGTFTIKNTEYTMTSLLRNASLARRYEGGTLCVFRLSVDDYHRYCYVDDGEKTKNYHISGVFHTVNPIANDSFKVYTENEREFSIMKSKHFGRILMMQVGALFVGKIVNHHKNISVTRGMEQGMFEYGGSTVILAFEKDMVNIDEDILENVKEGYETIVKMGEKIGYRG